MWGQSKCMLCTKLTDCGCKESLTVKGHAQCLLPRALACYAISLILIPRCVETTCTRGFWLSSPGQCLETGKFTPQTRLWHLYSSYLQQLGLFKAVGSVEVPWANGSGKLISKVCTPETCSTVPLWCIANAGHPRSQWIFGYWLTVQCLPPQIDTSRPIIYLFRDTK